MNLQPENFAHMTDGMVMGAMLDLLRITQHTPQNADLCAESYDVWADVMRHRYPPATSPRRWLSWAALHQPRIGHDRYTDGPTVGGYPPMSAQATAAHLRRVLAAPNV